MIPSPYASGPEFVRLLRGEPEADLTLIALEIALDAYPSLDTEGYLARINALADRVRDRCREGSKPRHILGQINWVLFLEEKIQGNTEDYYDARNSYLNQVLDRRIGIPISLSTLYLAIAERIGLSMSGVNLPAHFMVRTGQGESAIFVDPYHNGLLLDREGCRLRVSEVTGQDVELPESAFAACSTTEIVLRMLRNLKAVYLREHDFVTALPVLRRLVALTRNDPSERRDLGVSCLHAGKAGEAIDHLDAYLAHRSGASDAEDVSALLRVARREAASWN